MESISKLQNSIQDWKHKDRRCSACQSKLCKEEDVTKCLQPFKCTCKCTIGSTQDTIKKAATITGGVALFAGGTALAILCAPIALPIVIVGGIIGSAGASAAIHGITKSINGEKITKPDLGFDVTVGAVAGLLTGGIATGVGAISAVAGAGASTIGATIGTQTGVGVLGGVTTKAVSETATCGVGDKEWDKWGKSKSGTVSDTLKEWAIPIATGTLGGFLGVGSEGVAREAAAAVSTISADAVNSAVRVGGAVLREGATFGVKQAFSEDAENIKILDLAVASGTSAELSVLSQSTKSVVSKRAKSITAAKAQTSLSSSAPATIETESNLQEPKPVVPIAAPIETPGADFSELAKEPIKLDTKGVDLNAVVAKPVTLETSTGVTTEHAIQILTLETSQ